MKPYFLPIVSSLLVVSSLAYCNSAPSKCKKTLKIAIVDTGLDLHDPRFKRDLCRTGHHNFVQNEPIDDIVNHGTHVFGLIQQYAGRGNYCILVEKYYSEHQSYRQNEIALVKAILAAVREGANIINISAGGPGFDIDEYLAIKNNPKTLFIVAAGNEGKNLDILGNEFYPASYQLSNERAIGSTDIDGVRTESSNYGSFVMNKEVGEKALSTIPCRVGPDGLNYCNDYMSGTSMATAINSGKEVATRLDTCYND